MKNIITDQFQAEKKKTRRDGCPNCLPLTCSQRNMIKKTTKRKKLESRKMELELKAKQQEVEIAERRQRLELEEEERWGLTKLLQKHI